MTFFARAAVAHSRIALAAAALLAVQAARGQAPEGASTALADYVAAPDASYAWRFHARYERSRAEVIELRLDSQTWRGVLWQHQLFLIRPRGVVDDAQALFVVGGGRFDGEAAAPPPGPDAELPEDADIFLRIARRLDALVVVLGQVPYQPLFGMSEDRLIAYSFDRYLESGDADWPLLLPMVKSVVRAMDASTAAAAAEWGLSLEDFTLLGGSKRGWTTWLTAAVEPRVAALAPVVIDALNMERHFPYQTEVWGAPSEEIRPYTERGLDRVLAAEEGAELRRIVDPYSYREAIPQPKLVVLATNDAYFPVDSANLYWDGILEPKYLLYLPNDEHSIESYGRLLPSLDALHAATREGAGLPALDWEFRTAADALTLCVRSEPRAGSMRLWTAHSSDRDFREAEWSAGTRRRRAAFETFVVPRPEAGYTAVFADAAYGALLSRYTLSTNLVVVSAQGVDDDGPHPQASSGVCALAESTD
jgi:PhoPQ-activated pathogenicity-related protein